MKFSVVLVTLATLVAPNAFASLSYKCNGILTSTDQEQNQSAAVATASIQESGKDIYSISIEVDGVTATGTLTGHDGSNISSVQINNKDVNATGTAKGIESAHPTTDKNLYMKLDLTVNSNSEVSLLSGIFSCN